MTPGDGSGSSGVYGPRRLTFLLGTGPFQTLGVSTQRTTNSGEPPAGFRPFPWHEVHPFLILAPASAVERRAETAPTPIVPPTYGGLALRGSSESSCWPPKHPI
jgi:hypothetical protein